MRVALGKEEEMRYSLKGCGRCGGDLYKGWDPYAGSYTSCLQCGRTPGGGSPGGIDSGIPRMAATARHTAPVTPSHRARPP